MGFMELYRKSNAFFVKLGPFDKIGHLLIGIVLASLLLLVHPMAAVAGPALVGMVCELLDKNFDGLDLASWMAAGPLVVAVAMWLM